MQRGYGADYIDQYPTKLQNSPQHCGESSNQDYFDPDAIRMVAAGSMEPNGQPELPRGTEKISIRMDTPDAGWAIAIESAYRSEDAIIAISRLTRTEGMAAQVISTVTDSITFPRAGLPIKHFVIGKSWNWGDTGDYEFIQGLDEIEPHLRVPSVSM